MPIDRRLFLAGSAALAMPAATRAAISAPGATPAQQSALAAIAAYFEAHRAHFALPAMGMVVVDGPFTAVIQSGTSDYLQKTPLTGAELWQIGSISKSFIALICLQLVAEGKLDLDADIRTLLPEAPLPDGAPITVRGLLDHTTGLPDFTPAFLADGGKLWRGFESGAHWSYSNTAYNLIGSAIEHIEGRPLAASIEARIARPLGMAATRGAIQFRDRARYPASYTAQRPDLPTRQRNPLAPAAWVDASLAAGSVAAPLPDMARYLRYLIAVGQGRGAPLIPDALATLWLAAPAVEDPLTPDDTYGLGLMHRNDDGRALLHHTGGMVSFSSSFHVDAAASSGAFASGAVGGTGYRPRLLTRFACHALRLAAAGRPLPTPPRLGSPPPTDAAAYAGRYAGSAGTGIISGNPDLKIAAAGITGTTEAKAVDVFLTDHPRFERFALNFVREAGNVVAIDHGADRYVREGASIEPLPKTSERIAARAGHYQSDDAWIGGVTLVARGDRLFVEGVDALAEVGDDVWRPAAPAWNPERFRFAGFVAGQPQVLVLSGRALERRDG